MGNAGADAFDTGPLKRVEFEVGRVVIGANHFFKEEYLPIDCKPLHEMLGALIDKVPSEVRKTYDWAALVDAVVLKYSGVLAYVHQDS